MKRSSVNRKRKRPAVEEHTIDDDSGFANPPDFDPDAPAVFVTDSGKVVDEHGKEVENNPAASAAAAMMVGESESGESSEKGPAKKKLKRKKEFYERSPAPDKDVRRSTQRAKQQRQFAQDNGEEEEEEDDTPRRVGDIPAGYKRLPSQIKNKLKRSEVYQRHRKEKNKLKKEARKQRQKEREELGDKAPPKLEPRTIESTREYDPTVVFADDEEVFAEEMLDEFAAHFNCEREPKILITTSMSPTHKTTDFMKELTTVIPNSMFCPRQTFSVKTIIGFAKKRKFTDLLVFNEDNKKLNGVLFVHLPNGPTALFKMSSVMSGKKIPGHGKATGHKPELILNNFNTRLGHTIGRMFAAVFPQAPEFRGRRVVTLHNQRDFIFFRQHRYIFEETESSHGNTIMVSTSSSGKEKKDEAAGNDQQKMRARLQEIGPRFTLKLRWLQKGLFAPSQGDYEWMFKKPMETSRRRFFL